MDEYNWEAHIDKYMNRFCDLGMKRFHNDKAEFWKVKKDISRYEEIISLITKECGIKNFDIFTIHYMYRLDVNLRREILKLLKPFELSIQFHIAKYIRAHKTKDALDFKINKLSLPHKKLEEICNKVGYDKCILDLFFGDILKILKKNKDKLSMIFSDDIKYQDLEFVEKIVYLRNKISHHNILIKYILSNEKEMWKHINKLIISAEPKGNGTKLKHNLETLKKGFLFEAKKQSSSTIDNTENINKIFDIVLKKV